MVKTPIRLSVSAIRQYHTCPAQFYFQRIKRLEAPASPQAVFGTIVHLSFYRAYADPVGAPGQVSWRLRGELRPELALRTFDLLVERQEGDAPQDETEALLFSLAEPTDGFRLEKGRTKRMQGRDGWVTHYRAMLAAALENPLDPERVLAIELPVRYEMGGVDMLGYIDLVYQGEEGPVLVDLKTQYNRPSQAELEWNDQVARYYKALPEAVDFWLYHLRSGERFSIPRNDAFIRLLERTDREVAEILASDLPDPIKFPRRLGEQCHYCPYRQACWNS